MVKPRCWIIEKHKIIIYVYQKSGHSLTKSIIIDCFKTRSPKYNSDKHSKYRKLLVVRNPYTRIVSGFLNKYWCYNDYNENLNSKQKAEIKNARKKTFRDFVKFLHKQGKDLSQLTHKEKTHFQPQKLVPGVENIVKLENFNQEFINYLIQWGIPNDIIDDIRKFIKNKHPNKTPKLSNLEESNENLENLMDITYKEFKNKFPNGVPAYQHFYDNEIQSLVYGLYADEFKQLHYSAELPK